MALSFEAARTMILESVIHLPPEAVSLLDVVGMVIAEDIRAPWDMPLWNNSAMDGFAVRAEDCVAGQTLTVAKDIEFISGTTLEHLRPLPLDQFSGRPRRVLLEHRHRPVVMRSFRLKKR